MSDPRMIPADEADNTTPVYTEWQMEAVRSMFRSYQSIIDYTVLYAGLSHMVQDDGDGDWGAIWELIWEKLEDHPRQAARIEQLDTELDAVASHSLAQGRKLRAQAAQIERVREALAWAEQAENRAHADWIATADTHHRDAALAYTQAVTWLRYALGGQR